jgi:cytosine/adenosine deaminase-related metal-dependent hydrolase
MNLPWTLSARWIFPVTGPPLKRGTITIAGERILAVEPSGARGVEVELGDCAVLPGLVNAHTHLDLSGLRGLMTGRSLINVASDRRGEVNAKPQATVEASENGQVAERATTPTADFTGWLRQVIAYRRQRSPEQVSHDIRAGLAECIRTGTTLVGDISGDGSSWDVLKDAPLRSVVFREMLGLSTDRALGAWERFDNWLASHPPAPNCRPGISPHAPYSVRSSLFFAAATSGVPVAVHLAELAAEQELLVLRRGPFVPFLRDLGVWAPDGLAEDVGHVLRLLNGVAPTLLVHGNYLPPDTPVPENCILVYCPRTHAGFGHSSHPFREFLSRGVRVALGTDSLASNPDLDLLAEARFLHRLHPDVPGEVVLRMATLSGAEALGWADETGSLEPGKSADLVVVPLGKTGTIVPGGDPHPLVLDFDTPVSRVLCRGQWLS